MDLSNKIKAAAEYIKGKSKYNPTIGLILGSGLGAIADQIEDAEYFHTTKFQTSLYLQLKVMLED